MKNKEYIKKYCWLCNKEFIDTTKSKIKKWCGSKCRLSNYYLNNKEYFKKQNNKYYKENKEKIHKYYLENKEKIKNYNKNYYKNKTKNNIVNDFLNKERTKNNY